MGDIRGSLKAVANYEASTPVIYRGWMLKETACEIEDVVMNIANIFPSNFYTIDLAQRETGQWMVVEVGDGQVSGIPDSNFKDFYESLFLALS